MSSIKPTPYVNDGEIGISSISVTYTQTNDTNSNQDEMQFLTLETSDVPCGEDYPFFYNMKIQGHWSFNTVDELAAIINDFEARVRLLKD